MEDIVGEDVVFVLNIFLIFIGDIVLKVDCFEMVFGMYYFFLVEKMLLFEIIVIDDIVDWVIMMVVEYGKKQGKMVIVVKDGLGFYIICIFIFYFNEVFYFFEDGVLVKVIDEVMVQWGFLVGLLLFVDEVGIDVGVYISEIMIDVFGDWMEGLYMMVGFVEDDCKGCKNGCGFYEYDDK